MKKIFFVLMLICNCGMMAQTDKEYHIKTSDGVMLYVHMRGQGAPCLYLHGGPGAGSTWMKEMGGEELEKRFTMVYLDQRGFCKSTAPKDDNFSLKRQTLDFEEVRKHLGIEKWFLLGHSFGGILEIGYWRDFPNSICGMIFEDCTLSMNDSFRKSWLPAALEIVGDKADSVARDTTAALPARMAAIQKSLNDDTRALIFTDSVHKQVVDTLNSWTFHRDCICHTDDGKIMMIEDYWADFRPLTSTVTVPVLFFVGNKDRAIGPDSYQDIHFPNAIIHIGNCGHFPFLESPKEWASALDDYSKLLRNKK